MRSGSHSLSVRLKAKELIAKHQAGEIRFRRVKGARSVFCFNVNRGDRLVYHRGEYYLLAHREYERFIDNKRNL